MVVVVSRRLPSRREPPPPEPPGGPVDPVPTGPSDLVIFDNGFDPVDATVGVGSTLTWANTGVLPHTVTARDGTFDSGFLMAGDSWTRTFDATGTFEYFCTIHPEMVARLVVVDDVGPSGETGGGTEPASPITPGGDADAGSSASSPLGYTIDVIDLAFSPRVATVSSGTTVTWENIGQIPHTVTAKDESFDSGIMQTNGVFSWTFGEAGTYDYICTLHPGMEGSIVVTRAAVARVASAVPSEPTSIWVAVLFVSAIAVAAFGLMGGMVIFGKFAAAERGLRGP
jgi:plastocyanin